MARYQNMSDKLQKCCPRWGQNVKGSFQRFSDYTSMHGFHELFYAKSWFWRIIWTLILAASIAVTIYQIQQSVYEYIYQSSSTLIQPATKEDIIYPPLKFCVSHWISWFNWTKAYEMGFSKESILYSMSYVIPIYSSQHFNLNESKKSFNETLLLNKIGSIFSFYHLTAKSLDTYFDSIPTLSVNHTKIDSNYQFCYIINVNYDMFVGSVSELGRSQSQTSKTLALTLKQQKNTPNPNETDLIEYNIYLAQTIDSDQDTPYFTNEWPYSNVTKNYSSVLVPLKLFPDGHSSSSITIDPNEDIYYVSLRPTVHRFKSSTANACKSGIRTILTDKSCSSKCTAEAYKQYYDLTCVDLYHAILLNVTSLDKLCKEEITFLPDNSMTTIEQMLTTSMDTGSNRTSTSNPITTTTEYNFTVYEGRYNSCVEHCIGGCETWSYDVSVTTVSFPVAVKNLALKWYSNKIEIEYPSEGGILIMTDTNSQSWQNFIGNVGGLLGIWTGASILSLIQLFYLCCCDGTSDPLDNRWWRRLHSNNSNGPSSDIRRKRRIHTVIVNRPRVHPV